MVTYRKHCHNNKHKKQMTTIKQLKIQIKKISITEERAVGYVSPHLKAEACIHFIWFLVFKLLLWQTENITTITSIKSKWQQSTYSRYKWRRLHLQKNALSNMFLNIWRQKNAFVSIRLLEFEWMVNTFYVVSKWCIHNIL